MGERGWEEEAELEGLEMRNRGRLYWPEHRGEVGTAPDPGRLGCETDERWELCSPGRLKLESFPPRGEGVKRSRCC